MLSSFKIRSLAALHRLNLASQLKRWQNASHPAELPRCQRYLGEVFGGLEQNLYVQHIYASSGKFSPRTICISVKTNDILRVCHPVTQPAHQSRSIHLPRCLWYVIPLVLHSTTLGRLNLFFAAPSLGEGLKNKSYVSGQNPLLQSLRSSFAQKNYKVWWTLAQIKHNW